MCPPSIVMHLGRRKRNTGSNTSYNGWEDHQNHTIPPFRLDDRPPLLRHVGVRPKEDIWFWPFVSCSAKIIKRVKRFREAAKEGLEMHAKKMKAAT
ncbi:hypothetical protein ANN_27348 [Periplaneta americana]|uniref:Uncharacterized protein n=1 Tax=Periplaneta americana TaxID=6978 RepID=A0ABQ8RXX7_PERAM|nr:hypothetical protein ANN_27348 [Periplaneta americana]